ncbi:hypothetical protein GQR58_004789 [Nymphon striatum]|nr:hypothetical protein GQR58_004789 [Nymphon striatum]
MNIYIFFFIYKIDLMISIEKYTGSTNSDNSLISKLQTFCLQFPTSNIEEESTRIHSVNGEKVVRAAMSKILIWKVNFCSDCNCKGQTNWQLFLCEPVWKVFITE